MGRLRFNTAVFGIDPGPTTGLCVLRWDWSRDGRPINFDAHVAQCNHAFAPAFVRYAAHDHGAYTYLHYAIERFVIGRGSMRARRAGAITVDLVGELKSMVLDFEPPEHVHEQTAAQVKPWATDERLKAAGLLDITNGMRHARDAARHALFAAVKHCKLPDPLSLKGGYA